MTMRHIPLSISYNSRVSNFILGLNTTQYTVHLKPNGNPNPTLTLHVSRNKARCKRLFIFIK